MIVHPAHLLTAAASVHSSAADLKSEHDASHAAMESAIGGWVGASAASLTARLVSWSDDSRALDDALANHGDALTTSALEFRVTDVTNVRNLNM